MTDASRYYDIDCTDGDYTARRRIDLCVSPAGNLELGVLDDVDDAEVPLTRDEVRDLYEALGRYLATGRVGKPEEAGRAEEGA